MSARLERGAGRAEGQAAEWMGPESGLELEKLGVSGWSEGLGRRRGGGGAHVGG